MQDMEYYRDMRMGWAGRIAYFVMATMLFTGILFMFDAIANLPPVERCAFIRPGTAAILQTTSGAYAIVAFDGAHKPCLFNAHNQEWTPLTASNVK